jgi:hypothetical protein
VRPDDRLAAAVLKVGGGRGFVIKRHAHGDRVVITAAHCLPSLPPPQPCAYKEELTYPGLFGPLGAEPTVWAECLFADLIADIAVLGAPDHPDLYKQAAAFESLVATARPLPIGEAPTQRDLNAAECESRVLSLDGRWRSGRVERRSGWLRSGWFSVASECSAMSLQAAAAISTSYAMLPSLRVTSATCISCATCRQMAEGVVAP